MILTSWRNFSHLDAASKILRRLSRYYRWKIDQKMIWWRKRKHLLWRETNLLKVGYLKTQMCSYINFSLHSWSERLAIAPKGPGRASTSKHLSPITLWFLGLAFWISQACNPHGKWNKWTWRCCRELYQGRASCQAVETRRREIWRRTLHVNFLFFFFHSP